MFGNFHNYLNGLQFFSKYNTKKNKIKVISPFFVNTNYHFTVTFLFVDTCKVKTLERMPFQYPLVQGHSLAHESRLKADLNN